MSACWVSRVRSGGPAILGLAGLLMGWVWTGAAEARRVERVSVGPQGVVVESARDSVDIDDDDDDDDDRERYGRGGWIEVDDHGDALVRVFGDIHVPRGKRISDDVVAVFGSVDVDGEV